MREHLTVEDVTGNTSPNMVNSNKQITVLMKLTHKNFYIIGECFYLTE